MSFSWHCPFCGHDATIGNENHTVTRSTFDNGNKLGAQAVTWFTVTCPNPKCREYTFGLSIHDWGPPSKSGGAYDVRTRRHGWELVPAARMKILPDYVPEPIVADYKEACLIAELSPKASATLSRRCLQGMIRNYWGVSKRTLYLEIEAIKDNVDDLAWNAIDGVRQIGNIGAHMEADINVIVDVEPEEAQLLIGLIETLVDDWYVARHQKQSRMQKLVETVKSKFQKAE